MGCWVLQIIFMGVLTLMNFSYLSVHVIDYPVGYQAVPSISHCLHLSVMVNHRFNQRIFLHMSDDLLIFIFLFDCCKGVVMLWP
jgi:hypothetical protein